MISRFVGGAFGSRLRPQYHVFLAVLAARVTSRYEDFNETVVNWSGLLYHCDNVRLPIRPDKAAVRRSRVR